MKTRYLILGIVVFILCLNLVSAEYSYVFQKDSESSLHISCFDINNSYCLSGTSCQISIYYPNQTALAINQSMTYNVTFFDYNITNTVLGEHSTIVTCQGSTNGYSTFNYLVTPTGSEITSGQGFASIGLIIAMILLAALFAFFGFKFAETGKLFPIALFFMLIALILGVYTLQLGYIYTRDILSPIGTENSQFKVYIGIIWGLLGMAFIALLGFIFTTLKELKVRKSIYQQGEGWNPNTGTYQ